MISDIRYAFRQLAKAPFFTASIVVTLALGIGANTAFFSVVNNALLRPLPYPEQHRIVYLQEKQGGGSMSVSYPNFKDWCRRQEVFSSLAFHFGAGSVRLKTQNGAEQLSCAMVSSGFFATLGVKPAAGRMPVANDDNPTAMPSAWLTHSTWQRLFNGDKNVVGTTIVVDKREVAIAGILRQDYRFIRSADIYLTLAPYAAQYFLDVRGSHSSSFCLGRLKPGVALETARAQLAVIANGLQQEYPIENGGIGIRASLLRDYVSTDSKTEVLLLMSAVGIVLLIACVNVANMLLARSFSRTREMAIRIAVGATRADLFRQLLVESLTLAFLGGIAGALLGMWGYNLVEELVPWQVRPLLATGDGVDLRVLAFTLGTTLVTGVGFGLAPAWHLSHSDPNGALKDAPATRSSRWGTLNTRDILVGIQVALAVVLLVGAGLLIRSLQRVLAVEPGLRPSHVLTLQVTPPSMAEFQNDPGSYSRFYRQLVDATAHLPGVKSCAVGSNLPFSRGDSSMAIFLDGVPLPPTGKFPSFGVRYVTEDYFSAIGIPLLRGRLFDGHEPMPVMAPGTKMTSETLAELLSSVPFYAVISRGMAEQLWSGQDPIGKRFHLGYPEMHLPTAEVVGVVGDVTRHGLEKGPTPEFYLAVRQFAGPTSSHLILRTEGDPAALAGAVRVAIQKAFPDHPIYDVRTMTDRMEERVAGRKFKLRLFSFFAGAALLLSVVGLYGVLAFVVSQRTREIGIRMALGADRWDVMSDVLRRGLLVVLPGMVVGAGAAWAATRFVESQLFGVSRTDPATYALAVLVLLLAAAAACLIPGNRATRINPNEALRSE